MAVRVNFPTSSSLFFPFFIFWLFLSWSLSTDSKVFYWLAASLSPSSSLLCWPDSFIFFSFSFFLCLCNFLLRALFDYLSSLVDSFYSILPLPLKLYEAFPSFASFSIVWVSLLFYSIWCSCIFVDFSWPLVEISWTSCSVRQRFTFSGLRSVWITLHILCR